MGCRTAQIWKPCASQTEGWSPAKPCSSTPRPQVYMLHIHFVYSLPRDQSATVRLYSCWTTLPISSYLMKGLPTKGSSVSLLCSLPSLLQNWVGPNENSYWAAIPQDTPAALQTWHVFLSAAGVRWEAAAGCLGQPQAQCCTQPCSPQPQLLPVLSPAAFWIRKHGWEISQLCNRARERETTFPPTPPQMQLMLHCLSSEVWFILLSFEVLDILS